ncbi:hypothetical protein [Pontibacter burrus]|uniref:Outer membrane protein beta-barrel domain-containing protein n=1 Tax=Pontibacter burrus TaxID=2704466 RepID=A0A6B3LJF9_9BACT|nr:hypothetical protein [Pontibacter burrus]NEM97122.1 hypothetical protein [Pontibacter burrus]
MRKLISTTLLLVLCFTAFGQDEQNYSSTIRVQFGGAIPTGSFKSKSFDEEYPPFAISGPLLQVNYARTIKDNWAVGGTFALRRNPFNLDKFAPKGDELVLHTDSEPWQSVFTLADLYYQHQAGLNTLYLRGSLGVAFSRRASVTVDTSFGTIYRAPDHGVAPAYGLHAGFQQNYSRFSIGLETGVFATRPVFEVQGSNATYKQSMATINASMFLAYAF